jgi:hypothetical protein
MHHTDIFRVPTNCRFEIDDAEEEWVFSEKFDYIHGRALATCFKDPSIVLRHAFNSLIPGGYLELQDGCFPMRYIGEPPVDSHIYKWNEIVIAGGEKSGRPWTNVQHYKRWMEEIGFEEVVVKEFFWPLNPWAKGKYFKTIGEWFGADLLSGLEGVSLKVMGTLTIHTLRSLSHTTGLVRCVETSSKIYGLSQSHGVLALSIIGRTLG